MSAVSRLAVEVTKGEDFLNIWVDANNNGVRDDDDVNIYVSHCGSIFTESPTFKQTIDAHLKERLKTASLALMQAGHDDAKEEEICDLALELVLRATQPLSVAEEITAPMPTDAMPTAAASMEWHPADTHDEAAPAHAHEAPAPQWTIPVTFAPAEPVVLDQSVTPTDDTWAASAPYAEEAPSVHHMAAHEHAAPPADTTEYNEHGIPMYRPLQ